MFCLVNAIGRALDILGARENTWVKNTRDTSNQLISSRPPTSPASFDRSSSLRDISISSLFEYVESDNPQRRKDTKNRNQKLVNNSLSIVLVKSIRSYSYSTLLNSIIVLMILLPIFYLTFELYRN